METFLKKKKKKQEIWWTLYILDFSSSPQEVLSFFIYNIDMVIILYFIFKDHNKEFIFNINNYSRILDYTIIFLT